MPPNTTISFLYALERGTSPVDWCEFNYISSPFIAEIFNTISNILFLLLPPFMMPLFRQYAKLIDHDIYIIWILFALVGLCSAYFHATLSLLGQLLDELAIIWLLAFGTGMWLPRRFFSRFFHSDRRKFKKFILFVSLVVSSIAWIIPEINHFVLMSLGISMFTILPIELKKCTSLRAKRLGICCYLFTVTAIISWTIDRLFCEIWSTFTAPVFHGIWHLLIAIAAYTNTVLVAYINSIIEHDHLHPVLKYWPVDKLEMIGLVYIALDPATG